MEKIYIKVNSVWNKAIQELLDIALKSGGISVLNWVSHIINSIDIDEEYFENIEKEKQTQKKEK